MADKSGSGAESLKIRPTPSVHGAWRDLSADKKKSVDAWAIVSALLEKHPEYGGQQGAVLAEQTGPDLKERPLDDWLEQITGLLDPRMDELLHGRLVIRALAHLDDDLRRFLEGAQFLQSLDAELYEDFHSLMKPEHAKEEAYRGEFIRLLNNKAKSRQGFGEGRTTGFVVYADGGPGLATLQRLCFRQRWNRCLTARYVLPGPNGLGHLLHRFLKDLEVVARKKGTLTGSLLPEVDSGETGWESKPLRGRLYDLSGPDSLLENAEANLEFISRLFDDEEILPAGRRLVLFAELRGAGTGEAGPGINDRVLELFAKLPERMGIVLSGLPSDTPEPSGPAFRRLVLPPDPELTRGQALLNDTPGGPDRLSLLPEVNALAESIVLEEMSPPLVVGVLGGWGAGKSFVLHMLEQRIHEIRCEAIPTPAEGSTDGAFPFVGHPYIVRFDAWSFAKSNLWASLMQQIFSELDRQISLEQVLRDRLGVEPRGANRLWRLLFPLSARELDRVLAGVTGERGNEARDLLRQFEAGQITNRRLWERLERFRELERAELKKNEGQLAGKLGEREKKLQELKEGIAKQAEREARLAALEPALSELLGLLGLDKNKHDWSLEKIQKDARGIRKIAVGIRRNPVAFGAFVATGLLGAALAANIDALAGWLSAISGVVVAAANAWTRAHRWIETRHNEFEERTRERFAELAAWRESAMEQALQLAAAEDARPATGAKPDQKPALELSDANVELARELRKLDRDIAAREAEVEAHRRRAGITARHVNVLGLIRQRLESGYYDDRLGLMHQVQSDLQELSDALLAAQEDSSIFPRGTPRIMLMIDDLDRCPPQRVVEVLEAAQLLVKTRLFVVVLAMDVRYVTRALEKKYAGVLQRWGEPSGLDYIEKIIQIPYRVRPVARSRVPSYLRGQMEVVESDAEKAEAGRLSPKPRPDVEDAGQDGTEPATEPGEGPGRVAPAAPARTELRVLPTEVLKFTRDELDAISQCCGELEISPRSMKRLVNVFKLIKILWYRQGQRDGPGEEAKQGMLALLALAARFPEPLRQLLGDLEHAFRDQSDLQRPLANYLAERCVKRAAVAIYRPDWDRVGQILGKSSFLDQKLTLADLQESNLHIVSSFSFVGETDLEREAALQRNSGVPPSGAV